MKQALVIVGVVAALLSLLPREAFADDLVSGLSQDQIEITSNYTGTDLIVFGAIETRAYGDASAQRDVVVVVRGPDMEMIVRQKARVAGLWINRHEVTLRAMPGYYYVASTRPLDKIANTAILKSRQLGIDNIQPASYTTHSMGEALIYTDAAIRQQTRRGLFEAAKIGIEFLSSSLFRVRVPVPASVPRGQYTVEVYLFKNGNVVSAQSTPLFVDQRGLERRLFNFAHRRPLAYGVATVLIALLLGWLSSVVSQRR